MTWWIALHAARRARERAGKAAKMADAVANPNYVGPGSAAWNEAHGKK